MDYSKFYNSAMATGVAEIATQPICLVRTRLINNNKINISSIIKEIYHEQGILGFYRASLPAVASQMLSTSLKYGIYSNILADTFLDKIRNGILGGILVVTITNPIDVIKVNIQMGNFKLLNHPFSFFYRGYSQALYKAILGGAIYFPFKDKLQEITNNNVLASIGSAFTAITLCQPIDWAKTRLMNGNLILTLSDFRKGNLINTLKSVYTGYTLNLARVVPHFTITMVISDYLNEL